MVLTTIVCEALHPFIGTKTNTLNQTAPTQQADDVDDVHLKILTGLTRQWCARHVTKSCGICKSITFRSHGQHIDVDLLDEVHQVF